MSVNYEAMFGVGFIVSNEEVRNASFDDSYDVEVWLRNHHSYLGSRDAGYESGDVFIYIESTFASTGDLNYNQEAKLVNTLMSQDEINDLMAVFNKFNLGGKDRKLGHMLVSSVG